MNEHIANIEVERAVLGVVLSATDTESQRVWSLIYDVVGTPLAFYVRDHQLIALLISELWMRGRPCDLMSVYDASRQVGFQGAMDALAKLRGRKMVVEFGEVPQEDSAAMAIGGINRLCDLMSAKTGNTDKAIKHNALIVAEHYRQREAIRLANTAIGKLQSPSGRTDLRPIIETLTESLIKTIGGRSGTRSIEEALESVLVSHNEAKTAEQRKQPIWPLDKLQRLCRFRDGSFVVLAATSGGGKTSLALQTAEATAEHIGTPGCVGIVSREMTAEDLTRIMVARRVGCTVEQLERGELSEGDLIRAQEMIGKVSKSVVVCDSMEKLSYREVCAWARSQNTRTQGGLRMLVVDHIGLLDPENPKQSEYERITASTRAFKALAMELKIVVLALCQLNREGQRKQQTVESRYGAEDWSMIDLKGSGSLGHDADQCVFICKQGQDNGKSLPVSIKCDKNRWGSRGSFPALFNKSDGQRFVEHVSLRGDIRKSMDSEPSDSEDVF